MASGRQIQKKGQSKFTPAPSPGMFQPRPFAEPAQSESVTAPEQTQVETPQTDGNLLSRVTFSAPPPPIQPKLTIGEPNDKYEQEADRVAQQVVKKISTSAPPDEGLGGGGDGSVQRQMFSKPVISRLTVQRQEAIEGGEASSEIEGAINQAKSGGMPLEKPIRRKMEGAFGVDFSGVQVNTGSTADTLNRSLSARAFTTGNNIFFKRGEYNPNSSSGQELLAHELTHVVQQTGAVGTETQANLKSIAPQISRMPAPSIQAKYLDNEKPLKLFKADSNLSWHTGRGLLSTIDSLLEQYSKLKKVEKEQPSIASSSEHINKKLAILFQLENETEFWLYNFLDVKMAKAIEDKQKEFGDQAELGENEGPKGKKRIEPVLNLQQEVSSAIDTLVELRNQLQGTTATREEVADAVMADSMDVCLKSKVGPMLDLAVPADGGKANMELELKIPVLNPGYLGFRLSLEAQNETNKMKVRAELAATGGVQVPEILDIKAQIGGYVEAQAQNGKATMNLISYGLYRRFLESKLVPDRFVGLIWGGSLKEDVGKTKSQKWEKDVERIVFGKEGGEDAYVELGLLAGASAEVGDENVAAGKVGYKYTTAKKYSKESIEAATGGLGKTGGPEKKGTDTSAHEFSLKITVPRIEGEVKYKLAGSSREVEASLKLKNLGDTAQGIMEVAQGLKAMINTMIESSKRKNPGVMDELKDSAGMTMGEYELISGMEKLAKGENIRKAAPEGLSSKSARLVFNFEKEESTNPWTGAIAMERVSDYSLPDIKMLKGSAERSERLTRFVYNNGNWSWENPLPAMRT